MDFAASNAMQAANGLDILLWALFLYVAPRLLRRVPRRAARRRQRQQLRHIASPELKLKAA